MKKMQFAGLVKQSLVDYPGEVTAVAFSRGCNLACPFCHNGHLLWTGQNTKDEWDEDGLVEFLYERKGFLDAIVFSGGEPTLHQGLINVIRKCKDIGYLVKLDTNGTKTETIEELLNEKLIDYIAMDIKAPLEIKPYKTACGGRLSSLDFISIRNTVQLLQKADIMVEFRTTVVPDLHEFEDIVSIATSISGARLYTIQQFNPSRPWDINLKDSATYTTHELKYLAELCRHFVKDIRVVTL